MLELFLESVEMSIIEANNIFHKYGITDAQHLSKQNLTIAYRKLIKIYHPDISSQNIELNTEIMKRINLAFKTLLRMAIEKSMSDDVISSLKARFSKYKILLNILNMPIQKLMALLYEADPDGYVEIIQGIRNHKIAWSDDKVKKMSDEFANDVRDVRYGIPADNNLDYIAYAKGDKFWISADEFVDEPDDIGSADYARENDPFKHFEDSDWIAIAGDGIVKEYIFITKSKIGGNLIRFLKNNPRRIMRGNKVANPSDDKNSFWGGKSSKDEWHRKQKLRLLNNIKQLRTSTFKDWFKNEYKNNHPGINIDRIDSDVDEWFDFFNSPEGRIEFEKKKKEWINSVKVGIENTRKQLEDRYGVIIPNAKIGGSKTQNKLLNISELNRYAMPTDDGAIYSDINPHLGREAVLMIGGWKPAMVTQDPDQMRILRPHIGNGELLHGITKNRNHVVVQCDEPWRLKKIIDLIDSGKRDLKYHVKLGYLLGYTKNQIKAFIKKISNIP